jgi:hypothetical protein
MKRVYLDQMKWIDLARADKGVEAAARFADTLLVARRGVDNGLVSFPLSSIHYIETAKRRDERSRRALARTMATLSRFHTIASPRALVPPEIDLALHRRFGRPTNPRAPEAFGVGVAHALNIEADPCALPEATSRPKWRRCMSGMRSPACRLAWKSTRASMTGGRQMSRLT